jgi:dGTPase
MNETDIRQEIERREGRTLSEWAVLAVCSRGRRFPENDDPIRTCFMVDRDRITHAKSFRRLKHKTQVFIAPPGDHYRTRLTHTLEVSQISRTIGAALALNLDLIEAIALAHDVGHTPFAHAGEQILNELLAGGFRHSENSLRVLTRLERHGSRRGLNLTEEVLDGVRCHSGYGEKTLSAATLEGQVIRLSDKIAYVNHDIDDSIRAHLLRAEDLPSECLATLGRTHGERIACLVTDAVTHTRALIARGEKPRVELSPPIHAALLGIRRFMFETIYQGGVCQEERARAMFIIEKIYGYYMKFPGAMPPYFQSVAEEEGLDRAVADYISGMSDAYCIELFNALYVPRSLLPPIAAVRADGGQAPASCPSRRPF